MSLYVQMDSSIPFLTSMATITFFFFFFFLTTLPPQSACLEDDPYWVCTNQTYNCGNLTNISYPFFGRNRPHFCGRAGFELECVDYQFTRLIGVDWQRFIVWEIDQTDHRMKMVPEFVLEHEVCPLDYRNTSLIPNLSMYAPRVHNVSIFYNCSPGSSIGGNHLSCGADSEEEGFYVDENMSGLFAKLSQNCSGHIQVHAMQQIDLEAAGGIDALEEALHGGFDVQYNLSDCNECQKSGGVCGSRTDEPSLFSCYNPNSMVSSSFSLYSF